MKITDFNRLKKLMSMTRSDADAEVLMAIGQANKILEASGTNWENVFNRLVTLDVEAAPRFAEPRDHDQETSGRLRYLANLLADAEEHATGSFADFVADLCQQFERTNSLSERQVAALEASRARRGQATFRR